MKKLNSDKSFLLKFVFKYFFVYKLHARQFCLFKFFKSYYPLFDFEDRNCVIEIASQIPVLLSSLNLVLMKKMHLARYPLDKVLS